MAKQKSKKIRVHYVASTHWDREWYLPFQGFRFKLVKLIDTLIDILEKKKEYKQFVFDGQTVVLEDYLEIRPEIKTRLSNFIKKQRIHIGPWYVMPDERILSGESLIRNLLLGKKKASQFGVEAMKYGYICDIFGHIAQMPQIFNGFSINSALLGRGTNEHTHPANIIWKSPDGSAVVTFKLPDVAGYGMGRGLYSAAQADGLGSDEWKEAVQEEAKKLFEKEKNRTKLPVQLWLDGLDHQVPGRNIPEALDVARKCLPNAEILFSNLENFAADVVPFSKKLPEYTGELIKTTKKEGGYSFLISYCLSSHYPMKQANDQCQTLLEKWTEPFFVFTQLKKQAPSIGFIDQAWQYLIQNHPHDSICGCSVDQVHKDTEYRYDQTRLLGRTVLNDVLESLSPVKKKTDEEIVLSLFSTHPVQNSRVITVDTFWPKDKLRRKLSGFPDDQIPNFNLIDENGRQVPYQLQAYDQDQPHRQTAPEFGFDIKGEKIRISCEVDFNGIGVRRFKLVESDTAVRLPGSMCIGPLTAENKFLRLKIQDNGCIDLYDKRSRKQFRNLLSFEDTGEVGDGWYHVKPIDNQTFFSNGSHADISLVADGPLLTSFRIEKTMMIPEKFDFEKKTRSKEKCVLKIISTVTLKKDCDSVDINVVVENTVCDHRLRVLFPTEIKGQNYFAAQPFAFVTRKRGIDHNTRDWKEVDVEERSFCSVVGCDSAQGGIAIVAGAGLHEAAVKDDKDATIALTLFRSFRKTVGTPGEIRGQLLHEMSFDFCLAPFAGKADFHQLENLASLFSTGVEALTGRNVVCKKEKPFLFFAKGIIHLSALKVAEDGNGAIMRLYNPTAKTAEDTVTFSQPFKQIKEVLMDEEPLKGGFTKNKGSSIAVKLTPFKVRTFRIIF